MYMGIHTWRDPFILGRGPAFSMLATLVDPKHRMTATYLSIIQEWIINVWLLEAHNPCSEELPIVSQPWKSVHFILF